MDSKIVSHLNSPDHQPHVIRPIQLDDLEAVGQIDRDAFQTYRQQQHQLHQPLQLRTRENMLAALNREHPGVVIEWPPGRPVGYCFTHIWGSLGWLGTLGVRPSNQGFGLGRAIIAAGLDVLREAGCHTLALETMPENGKNLALYTRLGLDVRELTLVCQGDPPPSHTMTFDVWDGGAALRQIAGGLVPGLDPTPAAIWLESEEAGETLVWSEHGQPVAFAVLRNKTRRAEGWQAYLTVEVAACTPAAAIHWPRYLAEMSTYAREMHRYGLTLPVNTRQMGLLRASLDAGLKIVHTRVRMATGDLLGDPGAILLLTLAM